MMKTSLMIFPCVLGSAFLYIRVCPSLSFATNRIGHLDALYLLLLLVARYKLSYHKTICYHLFQYLQRIPCWKPLIISFCSSLGSTLLLIQRTTIDPLYLWVIRRHRAEHVQIAEAPCVWYLIGWIANTFYYINRVTQGFRFWSMRVRRHTLPSRCYASP